MHQEFIDSEWPPAIVFVSLCVFVCVRVVFQERRAGGGQGNGLHDIQVQDSGKQKIDKQLLKHKEASTLK